MNPSNLTRSVLVLLYALTVTTALTGCGGGQIDFENCILRAPLDDALSSFKLTLPNHIDSLVAIVWFYEADKQPLVRKWKRSKNGSVSIEGIWRVADYG